MLDARGRSAALQHLLNLPMRRSVVVLATDAGNVRLEIFEPRTGALVNWAEMEPKEADLFAGTITAVVTQIVARRRIEAAPKQGAVMEGANG